jgi:hypothetical protein
MLERLKVIKLEDMIGVVEGVKKGTIDLVYDLFFSDKRVVAAVVVYFSDLMDIYERSNLSTILFGHFLNNRQVKIRSLKLMNERRDAFKGKTLNDILKLHKANMEIDYENVISVMIRKGFLKTTLEFSMHGHPEKIDFWLDNRQIVEVEGIINRVLPNRAK